MNVVDDSKVARKPAISFYLLQAGLKLNELDEIINKRLMRGSWKDHDRSKHIRLHWLRYQSRVKALQIDLRSINTNLTTCLATTIITGQVRLQTSVQDVALVTKQISIENSRLNRANRTKHNLQDDHLSQLSRQVLQLQTNIEDQQSTRAQVEDLREILISGKEQTVKTGLGHDSKFGFDGVIDMRTSIKGLDRCNGSCTCCCHPKRRIQFTETLSSLTGSMCLSYVGGQISRSCDQSSCKRKLHTTFKLTYYFPRWFLIKVVSVLLSFDPAGSPNMSMQMPCIRPDTSRIFHLATAGDIEGMKLMFERGLASPNDVSDTFGYSVLHVSVIPQ